MNDFIKYYYLSLSKENKLKILNESISEIDSFKVLEIIYFLENNADSLPEEELRFFLDNIQEYQIALVGKKTFKKLDEKNVPRDILLKLISAILNPTFYDSSVRHSSFQLYNLVYILDLSNRFAEFKNELLKFFTDILLTKFSFSDETLDFLNYIDEYQLRYIFDYIQLKNKKNVNVYIFEYIIQNIFLEWEDFISEKLLDPNLLSLTDKIINFTDCIKKVKTLKKEILFIKAYYLLLQHKEKEKEDFVSYVNNIYHEAKDRNFYFQLPDNVKNFLISICDKDDDLKILFKNFLFYQNSNLSKTDIFNNSAKNKDENYKTNHLLIREIIEKQYDNKSSEEFIRKAPGLLIEKIYYLEGILYSNNIYSFFKMLLDAGWTVERFYHEYFKQNFNNYKSLIEANNQINTITRNYKNDYELFTNNFKEFKIIETSVAHSIANMQRLYDFIILTHEHFRNVPVYKFEKVKNVLKKLFYSKIDLKSKLTENICFILIFLITILASKEVVNNNILKEINEFIDNKLDQILSGKQLSREDYQYVYDLGNKAWFVQNNEEVGNLYQKAEPKDQNLFKLNLTLGNFIFRVLPDKDMRILRIGNETDCCQNLSGAGAEAAKDSFINSLAGVVILEDINNKLLAQSYFHYVPQDQSFILDNVEWNAKNCINLGLNNSSLAKLYHDWAVKLKEKNPEIKYIKVGKAYSRINENLFNDEKMENDPRQFAVDDPYSDFDKEDHFNLLNPKKNINNFEYNKDINKKTAMIKPKYIHEVLAAKPEDIVKTAGTINKIKNWLKSKFDLSFAEKLQLFRDDNKQILEILLDLNKAVKKASEAIEDGEIETYKVELENVKSLILKLWTITKSSKENAEKTYNIMDMQDESFKARIQSSLPAEIKLGTQRTPFKSIQNYKNLSPDSILLSKENTKRFFENLSNVLSKKNIDINNFENIDEGQIIQNLQVAITNGIITDIMPKRPTQKVPNLPVGELELSVITDSFNIPETNLFLEAQVILIDTSFSSAPRKTISVRKINYITPVIKKQASLAKLAEQLPLKYTTLNKVELANVLKAGYKMLNGSDPSKEILGFGWSQAVLEAGQPIKLPSNNIGNIKATNDWLKENKPYFVKDTGEYNKEGKYYKEVGTKWKAFKTPEEGALEYWKLLHRRYPDAIKWASVGDAKSAAVALGVKHYYTAPIDKYSAGTAALFNEFMSKIAPSLYGAEQVKSMPENKQENKNELDQLVNTLFASEMPLSNFIKKNTFSYVTAKFAGENVDKIEACRLLSHFVRCIDGEAKITVNGSVEVGMPNSEQLSKEAVNSLCKIIVDKMKKAYNVNISFETIAGSDESLEINLEDVYSNMNRFNLKNMASNVNF